MKINVAYPATGCQKVFDIDDEKKLRYFYEKRMAQEVSAESLGDEWKGYMVRITGGNDKQGFPMKQGVLTTGRARLLLGAGHSCYRVRRKGERHRKSVRGCIVDAGLSVLNLIIIKKGDEELPGLTDSTKPRRLGPKRASNIRKLFNLSKEDDVRKYVVRHDGKKMVKDAVQVVPGLRAPKIQRLVTPAVRRRKKDRVALKKKRSTKAKTEMAEYAKLLSQRLKERRERLRSSRTTSVSSEGKARRTSEKTATKPVAKKPVAAKPVAKKAAAAKPVVKKAAAKKGAKK